MQHLAFADADFVGARAVYAIAVADREVDVDVRQPGDPHRDDAPTSRRPRHDEDIAIAILHGHPLADVAGHLGSRRDLVRVSGIVVWLVLEDEWWWLAHDQPRDGARARRQITVISSHVITRRRCKLRSNASISERRKRRLLSRSRRA